MTLWTIRILNDLVYRGLCIERLVDIVLDIDDYRGAMRIFIP
ncbi:hypothetical protein [Spirulina sp. 06S082]|nr:hypothetical protein [Spirulina sp. 06S082]MEA5469595.1 hypothetical protein [Spirulina sp. 06S082]